MKQIQYVKDIADRELFEEWYKKAEERLQFQFENKRVETEMGNTEVLISEAPEAFEYPVVVLHGAMSGAAFAMGELADLPGEMRMHGINILGQSPRAEALRPSFKNGEYAHWLAAVMDRLGFEKVLLAAVSWGGSASIEFAKYYPERVAGMVLVVPGSIVRGSVWQGMSKIGWRIYKYQKNPTPENRDWALEHLMTDPDPDFWSPYLGDALRKLTMDFNAPPLAKPKELKGLKAPVYVIAADRDISFPGQKLVARSEVLFPNLVGAKLLSNTAHSPSHKPEEQRKFAQVLEGGLRVVAEKIA